MFPSKEENASSIEFKMFDQGFICPGIFDISEVKEKKEIQLFFRRNGRNLIIKGPLNALDFCENCFCGLVFTNMLTYTI